MPFWRASGVDRTVRRKIKEFEKSGGLPLVLGSLYSSFAGIVNELPARCLVCPHKVICVYVALYVVSVVPSIGERWVPR